MGITDVAGTVGRSLERVGPHLSETVVGGTSVDSR